MNFESNILHRDQWKRHIHIRVYPHTHSHTHTHTPTRAHTHTLTHKHTHTRVYTHIHKQGVTLHILVSRISSEGALEFRFRSTAQVHETNFVN